MVLSSVGRDASRPMSDPLSQPSEEQIAELAHKFWENEGQPEGKAEEHWARAQEQLRGGEASAGPKETSEPG